MNWRPCASNIATLLPTKLRTNKILLNEVSNTGFIFNRTANGKPVINVCFVLQEVDRNVRVVYERAHGVVVADKIVEENQFSSRVSAIGDQNKRAFKRWEQREKASGLTAGAKRR
jgi:hypothetical protein